MTRKQKAQQRNWSIFRLAGIVQSLTAMASSPSGLSVEEQDEAAQLSIAVGRLLDKVRKDSR